MTFFYNITIILLILVIGIPLTLFYLYSLYNFFEKCNVAGWKAFIPFYNEYVKIEISGINWWYIIIYVSAFLLSIDGTTGLILLSILAILFVDSLINYNLCIKINGGSNSTIIVKTILLTLFPIVFIPVIALSDKYTYEDKKVNKNSYIDVIQTSGRVDNKVSNKNNKKDKYCNKCGNKLDINDKFCPNCGTKVKETHK